MKNTRRLLTYVLVCWLNAQAAPEPKLKVEVLEGEGAINNIGERRAKETVVRVVDGDNQPVKDAAVNFALPGLGASGLFPGTGTSLEVQTDGQGKASGRGLKPNNVAGQFQIRVTASHRGLTANAAITQTNAAPAAVKRGSSKKLIIFAIVAGGAAAGAMAATRGGKPASQPAQAAVAAGLTAPPATSITPGDPGTFGPPH